ncbi:MAG: ClpV1 family T6SS ATPase [Candidatus Cloacimonetes bacterium 4572_55]|nr:MAG: ClpV1 family T6SS ATPase [Candidatus Cloacimonetes bacterium 4572_55]
MMTKELKKLLLKLNDHTTRAFESAVGFSISRTHYEVTVEHLALKLMEDGTGDILRILHRYGIDKGRVWEAFLGQLEIFRSGNSGRPAFSPKFLELIEASWIVASIHHQSAEIRSGHLLEALLSFGTVQTEEYFDLLSEISADDLRRNFMEAVAGSVEDKTAKRMTEAAAEVPDREGETALDLYTTDITGKARAGEIDPIFGRDKEIRQIIDILSRRRKNNPILVGEPGVGKTAVVEGFALRIAQGDVPDSLKDVDVRGLDLGLLQAGAGVKGEFENRLKSVIQQIKEAPKPIITFIDEAHTLIGAGGSAGSGDAANLLKPALARGELRTVAATTWSEYKKYFEKDAALERRFQMVKIDEPSAEVATGMLRGIKTIYEAHHKIHISDQAVVAAAQLAERYISGRFLPDKAVDLLDTSAARVKMAHTSKPGALDDVERRLQDLQIQLKAIQRDFDAGIHNDQQMIEDVEVQIEEVEAKKQELEERWKKEMELILKMNATRSRLAEPEPLDSDTEPVDEDQLRSELDSLKNALEKIQGEEPLVHPEVNSAVAAQVVSDWTGIPVGSMMKDQANVLLDLEILLEEYILGQGEAVQEISDTIRTAKAGLRSPDAPIGVFLFVGPSGIGKTECARKIAELLFGGERFVITINMSEYQESHTVSQLKGSPPGYVGYGEGGVLTEAVRQRPYSVVLLDEVEKAHRDVLNLFYQVFDKGFMRDGEGREIDFKNTIIMLTSNLASEKLMATITDENRPPADAIRDLIHPDLVAHFQAALLARMKVIPFYPLNKNAMRGIVRLKLDKIGSRLKEVHKMDFEYDGSMIEILVDRCVQADLGARNIDYIIDRHLLPEVSKEMLAFMAEEQEPIKLTLGIDETGNFSYLFEFTEDTN